MKKIKVAFIRFPESLYKKGKVVRGGSEIVNQQIVDYLRKSGVEVVEFAPKTPQRLRLIEIPGIGTPLMFQELLQYIDEINSCDVVITTNWFGTIIPEITKPLIVIFHSCSKAVSEAIKKRNNPDYELTEKWLAKIREFGLGYESHQSLHEQVISIEEGYFCKNANAIVAVSAKLHSYLRDFYSLNAEKTIVINNPYDPTWSGRTVNKDFQKDKMRIICVSRLGADQDAFIGKGGDRMLECFSRLGEIPKTLVIASGKKSYRNVYESNVANLEMIENAPHDKVADGLAHAEISLHFSRCEACQMTLIESMYMGTVPVSFRIGVAEELIQNGTNGFLINSVDEMIEKVEFLNKNPDVASKMAEQARQTIESELSIKSVGDKYLDLIKRLVG